MNLSDFLNGVFEFGGSLLGWGNVHALYRDKEIKGVRIVPTAFFFLWGVWNLFYYPYLEQWFSFIGGCFIVLVNGVWVGQMIYYQLWKRPCIEI